MSNYPVSSLEVSNAISTLLKEIEPITHDREGLKDTPDRVSRLYDEMFDGYGADVYNIMSSRFANEAYDEIDKFHSGLVLVKDIEFFSHCEHHMVPFYGVCHVGYIPGREVVGLSKLCRLVQAYAHRLQIQERMTMQIADTINLSLKPEGVMVIIEATHLCMKMRGIKNGSAKTITSAVRGAFVNYSTKQEMLDLLRLK